MDPWQLDDEQFWGALDTAAAQDDLRASEDAEAVARYVRQFREVARRPPTPAELAKIERIPEQVREMQAALDAVVRTNRALQESMQGLSVSLGDFFRAADQLNRAAGEIKSRTRQERRAARLEAAHSQPRTLPAALAHNARPVHRQQRRAGRDHRRQGR